MAKVQKQHNYKDSCFYKIKTKSNLYKILQISRRKCKEFLDDEVTLYSEFNEKKPCGGIRQFSAPRYDLKVLQRRINKLLISIKPPNFLMGPAKGKSYINNAAAHKCFKQLRKLDISNYYPNCTSNRVMWFFEKYMKCSIDVAYIMKELVTYKEALPQGSPCSPILAYLCYCDMWEQINEIVKSNSCLLTLYVDDITISSDFISGEMIWSIKKIIHKHGHKTNDKKERSINHSSTEVTGVVVKGAQLLLPNRQHRKIHELNTVDIKKLNVEEKVSHQKELNGRLMQAEQIKK